ncbi:MAG: hypothetical protein ACPF8V_06880, partial [Luteibaculum sp.]
VKEKSWKELAEFCDEQQSINGKLIAVGTGGNINKMVKLAPNSNNRSREISTEDISGLIKEMEPMSIEERMDTYDLKEDRADVIVPAGRIYETCLRHAGLNFIVVPKIGLADGMVYHMSKMKKYSEAAS